MQGCLSAKRRRFAMKVGILVAANRSSLRLSRSVCVNSREAYCQANKDDWNWMDDEGVRNDENC